jgi:hypothetical protein
MNGIPTDARRELYGIQVICAGLNLSYQDVIWSRRYSDAPKASKAWPFRRAVESDSTNVMPITKRGRASQ